MSAQILTDSHATEGRTPPTPATAMAESGARGDDAPRPAAGFTLVELMIAVVIIGVLAAIAIPNYLSMQKRASEGAVKSNMHTLQVSLEDFGLLNDNEYPTSAASTCLDGRTLAQVCPTGGFPKNPYTRLASVVNWNLDPGAGNNGELAINPALVTTYIVKGNGSEGSVLSLTLSSGN